MPSIQPWERRENEGEEAFEAFRTYMEMGEQRSTYKVSDKLSKSIALIQRWSSHWEWVDRCRAFDNHQLRRDLEELERDRVQARKTHANVAKLFQSKVVQRMQKFTDIELDQLTPDQLIKWFKIAVDIELTALGAATSFSGKDTATALQEKLRERARRAWEEAPLRYPTIPEARRLEILAEHFGVEPDQFLSWAGVEETKLKPAKLTALEPVM